MDMKTVTAHVRMSSPVFRRFALFDAFPKGGHIITDGGDGTQSGYNYSFLHIASDLCLVVPNRAYSQRLTRSHSIKNVADTNSQKTLVSADVLKRSAQEQ